MRDLFQIGDRIQFSQGAWDDYQTSHVYKVKQSFSLSQKLSQAESEIKSTPEYIKLKKPWNVPVRTSEISDWLINNLDLDRIKVTDIYLGCYDYKKPDIDP